MILDKLELKIYLFCFEEFFSVMRLSPARYARACAQGRCFCQLHNKRRYIRTNATHIIAGSAPASICPDEIDRSILDIEPSIPRAMHAMCNDFLDARR